MGGGLRFLGVLLRFRGGELSFFGVTLRFLGTLLGLSFGDMLLCAVGTAALDGVTLRLVGVRLRLLPGRLPALGDLPLVSGVKLLFFDVVLLGE